MKLKIKNNRIFKDSKQISNAIECMLGLFIFNTNIPTISTVEILETYLWDLYKYDYKKNPIQYEKIHKKLIEVEDDPKLQEILNMIDVWDTLIENDLELSENNIFLINELLRFNLKEEWNGEIEYRKKENPIRNVTYLPPLSITEDIVKQYRELIKTQNYIEIAMFIIKQQMFENANKRTAYFLINLCLLKENKMLVIDYNNFEEYVMSVIHLYDKDDFKSYSNFVQNNVRSIDFKLEHKKKHRIFQRR